MINYARLWRCVFCAQYRDGQTACIDEARDPGSLCVPETQGDAMVRDLSSRSRQRLLGLAPRKRK